MLVLILFTLVFSDNFLETDDGIIPAVWLNFQNSVTWKNKSKLYV